ncbi:MAG: IPT/TIG domain-containing protein [Myxococcota bacterium]|jgi:hypothetical protein|nr:IPT/TIG domain-containing protein [Myxococcota bacterium]
MSRRVLLVGRWLGLSLLLLSCDPLALEQPRLTALVPASRTTGAPTAVVIEGQGFAPQIEVSPAGKASVRADFAGWLVGPSGKVPLEAVRFLSSTALTAIVPAGLASADSPAPAAVAELAPGPYRLEVRTPQGDLLTLAEAFTVRLAPVLLSVEPTRRASVAGGVDIELHGRYFVPGTEAWIGPRPLMEQQLEASGTRIRGRVPPGEPGLVDIEVVSPYGKAVMSRAFTYLAPGELPLVEGIDPDRGPESGGTPVIVFGSGFDANTRIFLGDLALVDPRFDVRTPGRITGRTPPGVAGAVDVVAVGGVGAGPPLPAAFRYEPLPQIKQVSPASGPEPGGTPVEVRGRGFTAGTRIFFGDSPLVAAERVDPGLIRGVTPGGRGPVLVTARSAGGETGLLDGFTYLGGPSLAALEPATALGRSWLDLDPPVAVTLRGAGFSAPGLALSGDGQLLEDVTLVDDRELQLLLPRGQGTVGLVVRTDLGVAALPEAFTFRDPLAVDEVLPRRGRPGELLEVWGRGFTADTTLSLQVAPGGGWVEVELLAQEEDRLVGLLPREEGVAALRLTAAHGSLTVDGALLLLPPAEPPRVDEALPGRGPEAGGAPLALVGRSLPAAARSAVGGRPLDDPFRLGEAVLLGQTPPGEGLVQVTVTAAPDFATTLPTPYAYEQPSPPRLESVFPATVGEEPGTLVTVRGAGLTRDCQATLGSREVLELEWLRATELRFRDPGGPLGPQPLLLSCPRGTVFEERALRRLPDAQPRLAGLLPAVGPQAGGTMVTILGSGLGELPAAWLGESLLDDLVRIEPGRYQATLPAGPVGPASLRVLVADGPLLTLAEAFRYVPPTARLLVGIRPAAGAAAGGDLVSVDGSGLAPGVTFSLDGQPLTLLQRRGPSLLHARTPPGIPGRTATLVARWPDGEELRLSGAFRYLPTGRLAIDTVLPATGSTAGGTPIEIHGAGFRTPVRATLGGRPLLHLRVLHEGLLAGETPPGPASDAVLRVEADGEGVQLADAFRYLPTGGSRPVATALLPGLAAAPGGGQFRLFGRSLDRVTRLLLADVVLEETQLLDPFTLLVRIPASPAWPTDRDLELVLEDEQGPASRLDAALLLVTPPQLAAVVPAEGGEAGGEAVAVSLVGQPAGLEVLLGGLPLRELVAEPGAGPGELILRGLTPPGLGKVDVVARNPAGEDLLVGAYHYLPTPRITRVEPADGPQGGGTSLTLTGSGLTAATEVELGGLPLEAPRLDEAGRLLAVSPPGFGEADAETRHLGQRVNLLPAAFRYLPPLGVSGWWPRCGRATGGTLLRLAGRGFPALLQATLDDAPAPPVDRSLLPGREAWFVTPPGELDACVAVALEGSTGSWWRADAFCYLPPARSLFATPGVVQGLVARPEGGVALASASGLMVVAGPLDRAPELDAAAFRLPAADVRALAAPQPGVVLAATAQGLAVCADVALAPVCRHVTRLDLGELDELVLDLVLVTPGGEVLALGPRGAVRLLLQGGGAFRVPPAQLGELAGLRGRAGLVDPTGRLWVATEAGLCEAPAGSFEFIRHTRETTGGELPTDDVLALAWGPGAELYVGTAAGLVRFSLEASAPREAGSLGGEPVDELAGVTVRSLSRAADGSLWAVAGEEVVQIVEGRLVRRLGLEDGLPPEAASWVAADPAGVLWVVVGGELWRVVPQ